MKKKTTCHQKEERPNDGRFLGVAFTTEMIQTVPLRKKDDSDENNTMFCPLWAFSQKVHSQNGEDGILYYLFQWFGTESKIAVELCAGNGKECNTSNLVLHHDFFAFLFDGDYHKTQEGLQFFQEKNKRDHIQYIHAWITLSNLEPLFQKYKIPRDVDLLSLDMDGIDFWVLKFLMEKHLCKPRIIVLEYQDILGPDQHKTVPYHEEFSAWDFDSYCGPNYAGASLGAFQKLLTVYGYTLLGCENQGFNAFFVLSSELERTPRCPFSVKGLFEIPKVKFGMEHRYPRTQHLPWVRLTDDHLKTQK